MVSRFIRIATAAIAPLALLHGVALAGTNTALPPADGAIVLSIIGDGIRTNDPGQALFDFELLNTLPVHKINTHTSVTDGVHEFEGVLVRDVLGLVGAVGETVTASALNEYSIDIPLSDFFRFDVILAYAMDGQALSTRDKGPLWIVYPRDDHSVLQDIRYDYRWVWQLSRLHVR